MLQIFRQNNIATYIAIVFISFACKLKYILHPMVELQDKKYFEGFYFVLFGLKNFYFSHPNVYVFLSTIFTILVGFYLNYIMIREKIFSQKNYFVALSFVMLTGTFYSSSIVSVYFIGAIFLMIAFGMILKIEHSTKPRQMAFYTGALISLSSVFYFPYILFFAPFLLFIWILRPFLIQETIAYFLGIITVIYFALSLHILQTDFFKTIPKLHFNFEMPTHISYSNSIYLFASFFIYFLSLSLYNLYTFSNNKSILIRKKWRIIHIITLVSFLIALLHSLLPLHSIIVLFVPFSMILSQSYFHRNEKMNIFTFFLMIAMVFSIQYFLK